MNNNTKRIISYLLAASATLSAGALKVSAESPKEETSIVSEENYTKYIVKEGDTLANIALHFYGNRDYFKDIARCNNIQNASYIYVGEVLYLPNKINTLKEEVELDNTDKVYTVRQGDTVALICELYYGDKTYETIKKFTTYNNIKNANYIYEGEQLLLPNYEKLLKVIAYEKSVPKKPCNNVPVCKPNYEWKPNCYPWMNNQYYQCPPIRTEDIPPAIMKEIILGNIPDPRLPHEHHRCK